MTLRKNSGPDPIGLKQSIIRWARELGFQQAGVSDTDLGGAEPHFLQWLADGFHGEMGYMERHGERRCRPGQLVPGTLRIVSLSMDYLPGGADPQQVLGDSERAYIARYALGRDYHKLVRSRLQKLADRIEAVAGPFGYRVFCDSAPVLERAIAQKAGTGWIGKHSNLLHRDRGSWFFLGEIYTDLPLPVDRPATDHCGNCRSCIDACPTGAIVAPYRVDARRCIAYLTIELHGPIPEPLRPLIGNRIFGCDDCQLVCPWNRFAVRSTEPDFTPRHGLDNSGLVELFEWDEAQYLARTEGSALRRVGYLRWLRNIAVALGNSRGGAGAIDALRRRASHPSELVREHVAWALRRLADR